MTFPIAEPITVWQPGEFTQTGTNFLVDPSGNFLVDPSGNFLIDGGVGYYAEPITVWTESDGSE